MTASHTLPMTLRAAYLALHRRSDARFAPLGITADQFVLLATLQQSPALTQRELAQRMPSDPSTVRAMLVLLEKQGLVHRAPHPADSRARTASLTAAGQRMLRKLWAAGEPLREQLVSRLQPDEVETLIGLLNRVLAALNDHDLTPCANSSSPSTQELP